MLLDLNTKLWQYIQAVIHHQKFHLYSALLNAQFHIIALLLMHIADPFRQEVKTYLNMDFFQVKPFQIQNMEMQRYEIVEHKILFEKTHLLESLKYLFRQKLLFLLSISENQAYTSIMLFFQLHLVQGLQVSSLHRLKKRYH